MIDPLTAFLGDVDSHRAAEVRGLLAPLAEMAGQLRVAIVCVTHVNKANTGNVMNALTGSHAFAAAGDAHLAEAIRGIDRGIAAIGPIVTLERVAIDLELRRGDTHAALARLEGKIAYEALLSKCGNIQLATDEIPMVDSLLLRGPKSVPISFTHR